MAARDPVRAGAVLLAVVMTVGSIVLAWKLWPPARGGDYRAAHGTVVESVVCGPPRARDLVRVELPDGRVVPTRLDGCGHRLGEMLRVEVPVPVPQGEFVARLAGTGVSTATADGQRADGQRLNVIGVVLAGMAGALLAWKLLAWKLPGGWINAGRRLSS